MPKKPTEKTLKVKQPTALQKARKAEQSDEEAIHEKIRSRKKDEDVYDTHSLEELEEDDEISPWEGGFMKGAHGSGEGAKCRNCGKVLLDNAVERELHDEIERFCSDHCAESYEEKHSGHEEEE